VGLSLPLQLRPFCCQTNRDVRRQLVIKLKHNSVSHNNDDSDASGGNKLEYAIRGRWQ
jgi:hypothetical protein